VAGLSLLVRSEGRSIVAPGRTMGTAATKVRMDFENRPYVDRNARPRDAGTEDWADTPVGTTDGDIDEGSPAVEFVNDQDAIEARNDEGGQA
jgi:hypothetical protein